MKYVFAIVIILVNICADAQIIINEICAANKTVLLDEFGESSDWIELYNNSSQSISLEGWFISDDEDDPQKFILPHYLLTPGEYVVIYASDRDQGNTEIHVDFKLSSAGESIILSDSEGKLVDKQVFPAMKDDESFGFFEEQWYFYNFPSPGSENAMNGYLPVPKVRSNISSGIYSKPPRIELFTENGFEIRYSLDGTPVTEQSQKFEGSIGVVEFKNLRAAAFDPSGNKGEELQLTVLINPPHEIPIMHLSTDPDLLYNEDYGIMVRGKDANEEWPFYGANFWDDTVIPVHFDYFRDGEHKVGADVGMKIHGGKDSRTNPMKSFRLIADKDYGEEWISYRFFAESDVRDYKRIILRNASGDYNHTHFRDGYMARYYAKDKLDLDLLLFQPVVVYINGEYYGLLHIREKIDRHYIKTHYDLEREEIDLLEEDTIVVEGDVEEYNQHLSYVLNEDLSIDENFEQAASYFDTDHLIDYVAAQTVINNTDWPKNNIKFWREKDSGKWRYFLFDMDVAMGRHGWTTAERNYLGAWIDTTQNATFYEVLKAFWKNENYQKQFASRYADLLNSTFKSEYWLNETEQTRQELELEIERQFGKWSDGGYDWWLEKGMPRLYTFIEDREMYIWEFLRDRFNYKEPIELDLQLEPASAGWVEVNTIEVDRFPWQGHYFEEIPVRLKAQEFPGYTFSHWESNQWEGNKTERELTLNFQPDAEVKAVYNGEFKGMNIHHYPSPAIDEINISLDVPFSGMLFVTLMNVQGAEISHYNTYEYAGKRTINFPVNLEVQGIYFVKVTSGDYTEYFKTIIIP